MKNRIYLFAVISALFLAACNPSDPTPNVQLGDIIIVNEGNFGSGDGSLSLYNDVTNVVTSNSFETANDASLASSIVSLTKFNGKVYLCTNASDKVVVADAVTLVAESSYLDSDDAKQPRHFVADGVKGYVSCWGPWENWALPYSYVAIMDLTNNTLTDTIPVSAAPEGMVIVNGKLYVANSSTASVTVIDIASDEVLDTIDVANGPQKFLVDSNDKLWVICNGNFIDSGALVQINPLDDTVIKTVTLAGNAAMGKASMVGDEIFYATAAGWPGTGTSISVMAITATDAPASTLIDGNNFYGVDYDASGDKLYVSNSAAFASDGSVLIFETDGTAIDTLEVGMGPNSVIF